jgi:hypothetical protein
MLTVLVGARRVLLGVLMLAVGVMVGGLMMVVSSRVVSRRRLMVMLHRRVFAVFRHE